MNLKLDEVLGHVGEVLTEAQKKRGVLIHAFQQIQEEHNYLPEEELHKLSKNLDIPLSDVYSTATFYKQFFSLLEANRSSGYVPGQPVMSGVHPLFSTK
jgi:NADH:ubiquinone oxidoreductase subunit E